MEKYKKKGQNIKKAKLKVIDYIDDRGTRRRTYTTDATVERYIQNTYTIIENPSNKNLTSQKFCDTI